MCNPKMMENTQTTMQATREKQVVPLTNYHSPIIFMKN